MNSWEGVNSSSSYPQRMGVGIKCCVSSGGKPECRVKGGGREWWGTDTTIVSEL